MHRIASGGLLNLRQQRFRIAYKKIAHVVAILELGLQEFNWATNRVALQLHDAPVERSAAIHRRKKAECALPSDVCSLDCIAARKNGQQRQNGTTRKIRVPQLAACFTDYRAKPEINFL